MENHLGKYRIASVRHDKSHPTIVTSHAFSHRAMPISIRDVTSSEGQMTHLKRILNVGGMKAYSHDKSRDIGKVASVL
ncbi:hypothetical protein CBS147332_6362 [Penicillium roqueforti]|nr:hypothetical protein CBS147332_6362 [Penicillium roqueforti]KAI3110968.1 hypothetical protein CBS147331_4944 [Penicillium roqueforti]